MSSSTELATFPRWQVLHGHFSIFVKKCFSNYSTCLFAGKRDAWQFWQPRLSSRALSETNAVSFSTLLTNFIDADQRWSMINADQYSSPALAETNAQQCCWSTLTILINVIDTDVCLFRMINVDQCWSNILGPINTDYWSGSVFSKCNNDIHADSKLWQWSINKLLGTSVILSSYFESIANHVFREPFRLSALYLTIRSFSPLKTLPLHYTFIC